MGFKTKIQMIQRQSGQQQYYINFPSACAQMLAFRKGEVVEWGLTPEGDLVLKRNRRTKK